MLKASNEKTSRALRSTFLALIVAVVGGCASSRTREESLLHLRVGTAFLTQGNYPSAMRELLEAERLDQRNPLIQNNLGLAYFLRDRYETAALHLANATRLDPHYSEARNNYGRVLIALGRYDQAIAELKKVGEDLTYGEPAKLAVNLGMAYFHQGRFELARDQFAQAIRADRNHCLGQTFFGRSLLEIGNFQAAATALDNAVTICRESKFDEPYYFSGLSYYKLGRTSAAAARMEEVLQLYPDSRYAKKADSLLKLMR